MSLVVSDTSPLRALAHLRKLELLRQLFGRVLVPPAVVAELDRTPAGLTPVDVGSHAFIEVRSPVAGEQLDELLDRLDPGEAQALTLALQVRADAVLIDESAGRAMARKLGLLPIGVLGILLRSKQRSLIPAVKPLLDCLEREIDFRIAGPLRAEILRRAGE